MNERRLFRLVRVSVPGAMGAGALAGWVPGSIAGCLIGAVISWSAGAILEWQRQLGFTLGITQQLLPLGDQLPWLQLLSDSWLLVVPASGLLLGALWALIGALAAGLAAAVLNRYHPGVPAAVELDE